MSHDNAGNAVKEKLVFEDSLVGAQHIANSQGIPEQACHTALALTPERMLLLGSQGMQLDINSKCQWCTAPMACSSSFSAHSGCWLYHPLSRWCLHWLLCGISDKGVSQ